MIGKIRFPSTPHVGLFSFAGWASISTLAFLNFVINSGAVAGSSTRIL